MMIFKRFVTLFIVLGLIGCSTKHIYKGDVKSGKDVNLKVERSKGDEELKKSTASVISGVGALLLLGGVLALSKKYDDKKK